MVDNPTNAGSSESLSETGIDPNDGAEELRIVSAAKTDAETIRGLSVGLEMQFEEEDDKVAALQIREEVVQAIGGLKNFNHCSPTIPLRQWPVFSIERPPPPQTSLKHLVQIN